MALFQVVNEYGSLNGVGGTCALCNAAKRTTDRPERIVTTNLVTDMEDAPPGVWPEKWMEFCESCVSEMGQLLGMATEQQVQEAAHKRIALEVEIEHLTKQLAEADEALKASVFLRAYQEAKEPMMPTSFAPETKPVRTRR